MSVESIAIALHHSRASGSAKLVLIGIANHDGDGGAWPSVATLAAYAGVTARHTQRAIEKLEELGEIRRIVQGGGLASMPDHQRPNRYHFTLSCPPSCDRTSRHRRGGALPSFDPLTPTSPGDTDVTGGVTPTSPEPSSNQTTTTKKESRLPKRGRATCGHDLIPSDDRGYCVMGCSVSA